MRLHCSFRCILSCASSKLALLLINHSCGVSLQVRSMHDALLILLKSPVDAVRRAAGEGLALLATNMGTVYQVSSWWCGRFR